MKIAKMVRNPNYNKDSTERPPLPLVPVEYNVDLKNPSKCGSFKLRTTPADADSPKYTFTMAYADGTQDLRFYIEWFHNVNKVVTGLNITTAEAKNNMIRQLCSGPVLAAYDDAALKAAAARTVQLKTQAYNSVPRGTHADGTAWTEDEWNIQRQAASDRVPAEDINLDDIIIGLNATIITQACYKALEKQKRFMRRKMRKPSDMGTREYMNHLNRINFQELPHLPPFREDQSLSDDEMLDILLYGIPKSWVREMDRQDFDPFRHNIAATVDFCERMEAAEGFDKSDTKVAAKPAKKKPKNDHPVSSYSTDTGMWCEYHENDTHNTADCKTLKKLKAQQAAKKNGNGNFKNKTWSRKDKAQGEKSFTKKELKAIAEKAVRDSLSELNAVCKTAKRKADDMSEDSDSDSLSTSSEKQEAAMAELDRQLADFDFSKESDGKLEDGEVSC